MGPKLERLTYVHDGDSGDLGSLIKRSGSRLRFGGEASGLFEIERTPGVEEPRATGPQEEVVTITLASIDDVPPAVRELVAGETPCIVGHSGGQLAIVVNSAGIRRLNGTLSDLRGKVRFGLARLEWSLR